MVILIYGGDLFNSFRRVKELLADYQSKGWDIFRFDVLDKSEMFDINELKNVLETQCLFNNKKVVLIKNLLTLLNQHIGKDNLNIHNKVNEDIDVENLSAKNNKHKQLFQEIFDLIKHNDSKDVLIILWDNIMVLKKQYLKDVKYKEEVFPVLKGKPLLKWATIEATKLGIIADKEVLEVLTMAWDGDTWAIYNELEKLSLLKTKITLKNFLDFSVLPNNPINFELSNAIADKNRAKSLQALYKELDAYTKPEILVGSIASQIRRLLIVKTVEKNPNLSFKSLNWNPFALQKTRQLAQKFSLEGLKREYRVLFRYDVQIKKGKIDPVLALELFINDITR